MFHSLKPDLRRRLLSFDYPLDVIQLVQRFERCQVVHIQVQYLVAYLAQHRVVELEETGCMGNDLLVKYRALVGIIQRKSAAVKQGCNSRGVMVY